MQTPEEVAAEVLDDHAIQPHFRRDRAQVALLIEEAIERDRSRRTVAELGA